MSPAIALRHRLQNGVQALLLLAGMALLLGAIGWFVAGTAGVAGVLLVGSAFLLVSPRISPRFVLRMYSARPLAPAEAPELFRIVLGLSHRAGLPRVPQLFYIPSAVLNAFSVGRQGEAAVALTDGILRSLSRRELRGVLAHEIAHVQANDIWIMGIADSIGRLVWLGSLFGQALLIVNLPILLMGARTLPWWPILLLLAAPTASALLQFGLSRTREFDADLAAAEFTGDPAGLAQALDKLERAQRGLFERLFLPRGRAQPSLLRSHPATEDRIARLMALAAGPEAPETQAPPPRDHDPSHSTLLLPNDWPVIVHAPTRRWHGIWY